MSQQQTFLGSSIPATANIEFIQGNDGIPVPPDPATHIVQLLGNTTQGIQTSGNAGTFTETITALDATTAQKGVILLATNATTITGASTTTVVTPAGLNAKLGAQTLNALPYGGGSTAALNWLAAATNGQIPIGSTGNPPSLANITSTDGSITITNGPGTINLKANNTPFSGYVNVTNAMSPYTAGATDYFISVDASAGPVQILVPNAATANREFVVKDRLGFSAVNAITITTPGGVVTIDGQTTYTFTDPYESVDMLGNGTSYETF